VTKTFARDERDEASWLGVIRINADQQAFFARYQEPMAANVTRFYLLDRDNPTSIPAAIRYARENARTLRAVISTEMWLQINVFYSQIQALDESRIAAENLSRVCALLKEGCQAHTGITEGTFYRDQSWCFYQIGRHLERADQTTRLLDIKLSTLLTGPNLSEIDAGQWNALLRAAAGYHAYRRVYPHGFEPTEVVGFMLLDGAFPRSVGLNLAQLEWHLTQLRTRYRLHGGAAALERADSMRAMLTQQTIEDMLEQGPSPFLDWLQRQFGALHNDVAAAFFP
jgi:uncharacterized alpha-E superfamily protein